MSLERRLRALERGLGGGGEECTHGFNVEWPTVGGGASIMPRHARYAAGLGVFSESFMRKCMKGRRSPGEYIAQHITPGRRHRRGPLLPQLQVNLASRPRGPPSHPEACPACGLGLPRIVIRVVYEDVKPSESQAEMES
jgi:hypothetical protein